VSPDRLLFTAGAQHALAIAFSIACGAGGCLFTEAVTYPGALVLARHNGLVITPIALDREGMRPEMLDAALASADHGGRRRTVYVTPMLHNPTTATMGLPRRRDIVSICRKHDVLLIEDDVYSLFSPPSLPALAELAPERTLYVNGLSKTLSPGLRLGFLVAPPTLVDAACAGLQATSSMACPLSCVIMERWMVDGTASSISTSIRIEAKQRAALATAALPGLVAPANNGSLHGWLPMTPTDAERFASRAGLAGVTVTPPSTVMVDSTTGLSGIRICFGGPKRSDLSRALAILRRLLDREPNGGADTSIMI
jgi:DNA-binding transcriptional MocR family regulator